MPTFPQPCALVGHDPAPTWVLRPALVGAGVVVPAVHFDRACRRGKHQARIEWRAILGDVQAQPTTMPLAAWLVANQATIDSPPDGEVVTPDAAELATISQAVRGNGAQRRTRKRKA